VLKHEDVLAGPHTAAASLAWNCSSSWCNIGCKAAARHLLLLPGICWDCLMNAKRTPKETQPTCLSVYTYVCRSAALSPLIFNYHQPAAPVLAAPPAASARQAPTRVAAQPMMAAAPARPALMAPPALKEQAASCSASRVSAACCWDPKDTL
jgi:hypothetical protein